MLTSFRHTRLVSAVLALAACVLSAAAADAQDSAEPSEPVPANPDEVTPIEAPPDAPADGEMQTTGGESTSVEPTMSSAPILPTAPTCAQVEPTRASLVTISTRRGRVGIGGIL